MKYKNHRYLKNKGFTLIEMVIYIALFSIMMGGLIVTVYQLYQSAGAMNSKVTEQEEINFVIKKIDWVLTGAYSSSIVISNLHQKLSVYKTGFSSNPIIIRFNSVSKDIEIQTGGAGTFYPLTTKNVKVKSLEFNYNSDTKIITYKFIINGIATTSSKYLRI